MVISLKAKDDAEEVQEEKLEDILRSIRGMIDNHNPHNDNVTTRQIQPIISKKDKIKPLEHNSKDSVLELTDEFVQEAFNVKSNTGLTSDEIINKSAGLVKEFAKDLAGNQYSHDNKLEMIVTDLLKPLLKDWLDHNLPKLVEKMIAEELKRLVPKK